MTLNSCVPLLLLLLLSSTGTTCALTHVTITSKSPIGSSAITFARIKTRRQDTSSSSSNHHHHHHHDTHHDKEQGWRRAIISRLVLPGRKKRTTTSQLMVTTASMSDAMTWPQKQYQSSASTVTTTTTTAATRNTMWNTTTFILYPSNNMTLSTSSPYASNYRTWQTPTLALENVDSIVSTTTTTTTAAAVTTKSTPTNTQFEGGSMAIRMTRSYIEFALLSLIQRHTIDTPHSLIVKVAPTNVLGRIVRGTCKADVMASFQQLNFLPLKLSSGTVEAKRLKLNLLSFISPIRHLQVRFPSSFDLLFTNLTWTEQDLLSSRCIKRGLEGLLLRILSRIRLKPDSCTITSITILSTGQLSISGHASSTLLHVPFCVKCSHVDIASRGHVISFSGVQVSVAMGLFVQVQEKVDLDIGHNARMDSIVLNQGTLALTGQATITPTRKVTAYRQSAESYSAHAFFDVGQWLTRLGNFTA